MAKQSLVTLQVVEETVVATLEVPKISDEEEIQRIYDALVERVDAVKGIRMVIDFTDVDFMSSAFLSKLVSLRNKVRRLGGRIVLAGIHPDQRDVFEVANLGTFFVFSNTLARALRRINQD